MVPPSPWKTLKNQPLQPPPPALPTFIAETTLLLTDGTVMCHGLNTNMWQRLTPDKAGNYINGTWSSMASMLSNTSIPISSGGPTYASQGFASAVLSDGTVFVAGGENNNRVTSVSFPNGPPPEILNVEIYDPVSDSWRIVNPPNNWTNIGDAPSRVLPDGRVLLGSIGTTITNTPQLNTSIVIYDPSTQTWSAAANKGDSSQEETFTLLPNNTILTVQCSNIPHVEKYLIDSDQWITEVQQTPSTLPQACPAIRRSFRK